VILLLGCAGVFHTLKWSLIQFKNKENFTVLLLTSESSDVENSIPGGDGDGSKIGTEVCKTLQFWQHLPCDGPWQLVCL